MIFSYERRVSFSDTDALGVVHHANYLRYCEEARVAWMRQNNLSEAHYPKNNKVLAVLHYQVWHLKPARFDDALTVRLQVRQEGVKIRFQYSMLKDDELLAQGETLHIALDSELKPSRPDPRMLKQLEKEAWTETWLLNS